MKSLAFAAMVVMGFGAYNAQPVDKPTLCYWIVRAGLNGGPVTGSEIVRCRRALVRIINEDAERYARAVSR